MNFSLNIEKVGNGFVITPHSDCEGEVNVVEFDEYSKDDSKLNREKMQELLYMILDFFGERGTKHDNYRVVIDVVNSNG